MIQIGFPRNATHAQKLQILLAYRNDVEAGIRNITPDDRRTLDNHIEWENAATELENEWAAARARATGQPPTEWAIRQRLELRQQRKNPPAFDGEDADNSDNPPPSRTPFIR